MNVSGLHGAVTLLAGIVSLAAGRPEAKPRTRTGSMSWTWRTSQTPTINSGRTPSACCPPLRKTPSTSAGLPHRLVRHRHARRRWGVRLPWTCDPATDAPATRSPRFALAESAVRNEVLFATSKPAMAPYRLVIPSSSS